MSGVPSSTATGAVVLVAHGSRDPAAAVATRALARAVGAIRPDLAVRASFLDHTTPSPDRALAALAAGGCRDAVVVPLLLTAAYHRRVDLPAILARLPELPVTVTDVLGPVAGAVPRQLVAGLRRRLHEATAGEPYDAVVLAAAGTRDAGARETVAHTARVLAGTLGVPCRVGYASAAEPSPAGAVAGLRAAGARRVAVAAYFLAPGRLYRAAVAAAVAEGAVAAAAPLADLSELAELVLVRTAQAQSGQQKAPEHRSGALPLAC